MGAWGILAADVIVMATLDRFNPFTLDFGTVIMPAVNAAIFNDLGWDTAVSVNEETRQPSKTPRVDFKKTLLSSGLMLGAVLMVVWLLRQSESLLSETLSRHSDDRVLVPREGCGLTFGPADFGLMLETGLPRCGANPSHSVLFSDDLAVS